MKTAYHQFSPSDECKSIVEEIWVQESDVAPMAEPTTILPSGRIELVIHYGDPFVLLHDTGSTMMTTSHIVGQQYEAMSVKATGKTGIVIVRFYPWSASALLRQPLTEFSEQVVELSQLWPQEVIDRLLDKIHSATIPRERATVVDDFICAELRPREPDSTCRTSINLMNTNWGRPRINSIAAQLGLSRRQLSRRFASSTGTSPKKMSRILRAQKALACIRNGWNSQDVVDVCGYADQSHFIHDVIAHSGSRPSELVEKENSSLQQYFNTTDVDDFCGQAYL